VAIARPIGMPGQDQAKTTPLGSVGLAAVHRRSSGFEACYRRPIRLPDDLSYTRDRCVNTMTILCGNATCPFLQVRAAERRRRRPLWKTDGGGGQLGVQALDPQQDDRVVARGNLLLDRALGPQPIHGRRVHPD